MRSNLALLVTVAVALSTIMVVPAARASTSVPIWASGDYWVYTTSGSFVGPTALTFGTGTVRYDVVGAETITVQGSSILAYHTKVNYTWEATSSVNATLLGDEWFRVSDLAPAKESISTVILSTTYTITILYIPPPQVQWPLTANATWSATTTFNATSNLPGFPGGSFTGTIDYAVQADTSLTVAAGTFTVTPVKESTTSSTSYAMTYWSANAGNAASRRGYSSGGSQVGSWDLKSYSYTGAGGLLDTVFLGLNILIWVLIFVIVVVVIVAMVVLLRRKRAPPMAPMAPGMPPGYPPQMPPQQPPQTPPGPPPSP